MANSPFNIIKTHLWSEVKEYTWGNLTIGQNYKTVLSNVQSSQTTKKDNKKTFASTLLTGIGNVRKNLIGHYITGISVGSTAIRKTTRLLGSIVNVIVSTSKYIRSFVSSLTSSASSLATKLIVQLYTIPKTVIAGINLNSNSLRKTQSIVNGYIGVVVGTIKNISRLVSLHITIISTRNNTNNSTVGTLVNSYAAKVSKSAKQLKSNVVLSSMKLSTVAKQLKCNIQNISSKLVFITRTVNTVVNGIIVLLRKVPYKKLLVATVNIVYNAPPIKWADNKVRTWADLTAYRWREFNGIFATGVWKNVFRKISSSTNIVVNVKNNIKRLVTSYTNITSQTKKSINRTIQSLTDSLNNVIKMLHREAISSIKVDAISYKGFFQLMLTYIATDASKYLTFFKIVSGLVSITNTFISRFGKAVVQSITTIAVHSFNIFLSVVKEHSIKMSAIHKLKQEVIWRMGANARGETLHMVLGETKVIELTVVNEDGTPTDLAGADVKFAISGAVEKDCGIEDNKITVMIEPDDIKNTGTYDYEFRLKDIFNRVDSLIMGKVIVEPKVVSAY